jgi:hypothetical protein
MKISIIADPYRLNSVVDPDPYVFGPPGSVSQVRIRIRILLSSSKNSKKNLDFPLFCDLIYDFLTLRLM